MSNSILADTKKALGLAPDYTPFDADIILHINAVLSDLNQLGIGPDLGFEILDDTATWTEFLADDLRLNGVKSYLYLRVKMLFDPPNVGYVLTSLEKMIEKAEWRINMAREEIKYPPVVEVVDPAQEEPLPIADGGDMADPPPTEEPVLDGGVV